MYAVKGNTLPGVVRSWFIVLQLRIFSDFKETQHSFFKHNLLHNLCYESIPLENRNVCKAILHARLENVSLECFGVQMDTILRIVHYAV